MMDPTKVWLLPETFVIRWEQSPPVQDSANPYVIFFLFARFTIYSSSDRFPICQMLALIGELLKMARTWFFFSSISIPLSALSFTPISTPMVLGRELTLPKRLNLSQRAVSTSPNIFSSGILFVLTVMLSIKSVVAGKWLLIRFTKWSSRRLLNSLGTPGPHSKNFPKCSAYKPGAKPVEFSSATKPCGK